MVSSIRATSSAEYHSALTFEEYLISELQKKDIDSRAIDKILDEFNTKDISNDTLVKALILAIEKGLLNVIERIFAQPNSVYFSSDVLLQALSLAIKRNAKEETQFIINHPNAKTLPLEALFENLNIAISESLDLSKIIFKFILQHPAIKWDYDISQSFHCCLLALYKNPHFIELIELFLELEDFEERFEAKYCLEESIGYLINECFLRYIGTNDIPILFLNNWTLYRLLEEKTLCLALIKACKYLDFATIQKIIMVFNELEYQLDINVLSTAKKNVGINIEEDTTEFKLEKDKILSYLDEICESLSFNLRFL